MTDQYPGQPRHGQPGDHNPAAAGGFPQASGGYPAAETSGGYPAAGAHSSGYESAATDSTSVMPNAHTEQSAGAHAAPAAAAGGDFSSQGHPAANQQQGFAAGQSYGDAQVGAAQHQGYGQQQAYGQQHAYAQQAGAQAQRAGTSRTAAAGNGLSLGLPEMLSLGGAAAAVLAFFTCFLTFNKADLGSYFGESASITANGFDAAGWFAAAMLAAAIVAIVAVFKKESLTPALGLSAGAWLALLFDRFTSERFSSGSGADATNWGVGAILAVLLGIVAVALFAVAIFLPAGALGGTKNSRSAGYGQGQGAGQVHAGYGQPQAHEQQNDQPQGYQGYGQAQQAATGQHGFGQQAPGQQAPGQQGTWGQ